LRQVTIVGLGLIGGSIAKAVRRRLPDITMLAIDRGEVGERPDIREVVSEFVPIEASMHHQKRIRASDLVVLCQPVRAIAETITEYLSPGTAVTDTGSTKRLISTRANACPGCEWFVPGHPMAGRAVGGFDNSSPDLFVSRPWIMCSEMLIDLVGARRIVMSPAEHDAAVAITSHVPQLLASWLQMAAVDRNALAAAGPAFVEMTRTAGGSESIWRDIFESNSDEVGRALKESALALAAIADALLSEPPRIEAVLDVMRRARRAREATSQ
jgi:prephenate dehydrogenase